MNAAIYARWSAEGFDLDTQVAVCNEFMTRTGLGKAAFVYSDDGPPSDPATCLTDAELGRFDMLVASSSDRLSKNAESEKAIREHLEGMGVTVLSATVSN